MDSIDNYWMFWLLYLISATIFTAVFWRLTRFQQAVWTAYSLRAVALAVIFTPWYSNPQGSEMAPALMVATLDAITVGGSAAFRSFVPLIMAILFGLFVAGVLAYRARKNRNIGIKNNKIDLEPKAQ